MDPTLEVLSQDTPLRLDVAVKVAFPAGGMSVAGLRKEIAKGRLEVELIANKLFTTLAAIARMRELCRVVPKKTRMKERAAAVRGTTASDDQIGQARLEAMVAADVEKFRKRRRRQDQ